MNVFQSQADEFFRALKDKNVRKGNRGFLVYAIDGILDYCGESTATADKHIANPMASVAGCYCFDDPSFSKAMFMDDCEIALRESIQVAEDIA